MADYSGADLPRNQDPQCSQAPLLALPNLSPQALLSLLPIGTLIPSKRREAQSKEALLQRDAGRSVSQLERPGHL